MPDEHGTLQAFGVIFACWGLPFFGVWAIPIAENLKIFFDIYVSVFFAMFGFFYFMYKGKIPTPKKETFEKITFWLSLPVLFIQTIMAFVLNVIFWEVVTINDIYVVTYIDLFSLIYGIMGIGSIIFTYRFIKKRNPYKKKTPNIAAHLIEVYSPIHAMIVRINNEIPREQALQGSVGVWVRATLIDFNNISAVFNQHIDKFRDKDLKMWIDIEKEIKAGNGFYLGNDRQKWFDELETEYNRLKKQTKTDRE